MVMEELDEIELGLASRGDTLCSHGVLDESAKELGRM